MKYVSVYLRFMINALNLERRGTYTSTRKYFDKCNWLTYINNIFDWTHKLLKNIGRYLPPVFIVYIYITINYI